MDATPKRNAEPRVMFWVRPRTLPRVRGYLLGSLLTTVGAITATWTLSNPEIWQSMTDNRELALGIAIIACLALVASGPALTLMQLRQSWRDDAYLIAYSDRLLIRSNGIDEEHDWNSLKLFQIAGGHIEAPIENNALLRIPACFTTDPSDAKRLCERLEQARKRALFGLFRPT